MKKTISKGACLAQPLETQASDSAGFQNELHRCILELDESKMAYDKILVGYPFTRCLFAASLITWADWVNKGLLDYLERIGKGECVEVLNVNYKKFASKEYWLNGRLKSDMMACRDIPLDLKMSDFEFKSSAELYEAFEEIVCEMATNFNKVENTFNRLELYAPVLRQMNEQYGNPLLVYEYALMKEEYIEPSLRDFLKMQVKVCVEFLHSGMLNDMLSIANDDVDEVDEVKLHKMMDTRCKVPENLKELWAILKKFIEVKDNLMIVPRRDLLLRHVLKHKITLTVEQIRAFFRFDKLLYLIHQDMVKMKPELAKHLKQADETNTFGILNSLTRLIQQPWFKDFCTDPKYDDAWIEKFVSDLLASEHRQELLDIWQVAKKRQNLKSNIIGCLKMAGVIDGSDLGIATALLNGSKKENTNFAVYMGRGKKMAFCDWICNYVRR